MKSTRPFFISFVNVSTYGSSESSPTNFLCKNSTAWSQEECPGRQSPRDGSDASTDLFIQKIWALRHWVASVEGLPCPGTWRIDFLDIPYLWRAHGSGGPSPYLDECRHQTSRLWWAHQWSQQQNQREPHLSWWYLWPRLASSLSQQSKLKEKQPLVS